MLRIFKVKRAVKNINPLEDSSATYYEEVNMGGLMPNERALKVCYQNGDIWKLKDFTTKTEQVEIQKILNSTLYEFNGFFIIKNKNDAASREYYCFITVDKANEVLEDKHWLIWLTVYYDLNGSTGFKILLRWDLEQFIFTIVKNPIQINLLENDNFNKEENHYSLPTVAVIRKWYYHKEWLEINTPINNSQSMIYSIPKKCPMEDIEIDMPKEDVIRQLIRARTNMTDKEYDLLSMDFGRQPGYNGYNSMIISMNQINSYDNMKAGNGYAWLSFLGDTKNSKANFGGLLCKITDTEGNVIKHTLYKDVLNAYGLKFKRDFDKEDWIIGSDDGLVLLNNSDYFCISKPYDTGSFTPMLKPNAYYLYLPYQLHFSILLDSNNKFIQYSDERLIWEYNVQKTLSQTKDTTLVYQKQLDSYCDKPLEERYYMPIWGKLSFQILPLVFVRTKINDIIPSYIQVKTWDYYYGHNSHLQLKYLVGYWKARS